MQVKIRSSKLQARTFRDFQTKFAGYIFKNRDYKTMPFYLLLKTILRYVERYFEIYRLILKHEFLRGTKFNSFFFTTFLKKKNNKKTHSKNALE